MATKTQLAIGGTSAATASAAVGTGVVLGTGGKGEKIEVEDLNDTIDKNEEDKDEEIVQETSEKDKNPKQTTESKEITKKRTNPKFPGKPFSLEEIKIDDTHLQPEVIKSTVDSQDSYPDKSLARPENNSLALVSAKHKGNEWWWDLSFNEKFNKYKQEQQNLHSVYQNVNKAFEEITQPKQWEENPQSLNKACHLAYSKTAEPFYQEDGLYSQTRLFCTLGMEGSSIEKPHVDKPEKEPTLIKETNNYANTYQDKLALWGSNEDHFVSGKSSDDKDWWIWKFSKTAGNLLFWRDTEFSTIFRQIKKPYSDTKEDGSQIALNQACEVAYLLDAVTEDTDNKLKENIKEYCTKNYSDDLVIAFNKD